MAHVTASHAEGFSEVGRLDERWGFKKNGGEDEAFQEAEAIGFESLSSVSVEAASCAVDGEHGALMEEGIDAHEMYVVYSFNYQGSYEIMVVCC